MCAYAGELQGLNIGNWILDARAQSNCRPGGWNCVRGQPHQHPLPSPNLFVPAAPVILLVPHTLNNASTMLLYLATPSLLN